MLRSLIESTNIPGKPPAVTKAMTLAWAGFTISFAASWLSWVGGALSYDKMAVTGVIFALFALLIWRMDCGGFWARHLYAAFFLVGTGSLAANGFSLNGLEQYAGAVTVPLEAGAIWLLYSKESREWHAHLAELRDRGMAD